MNTSTRKRRVMKRLGAVLLVLLALIGVGGLWLALSQDGAVRVLQALVYRKMDTPANSFTPRQPPARSMRGGLRVVSDLRYGSQYPNSFLDIWYAGTGKPVPTIVYMHGGGFFMGSKDWGDPLAGGGDPNVSSEPLAVLARAGFNVVNLDYALSPAYRYPVPLRQLDQAIAFLKRDASKLRLDMSRVFVMGGSAGAQLSAQYGLLLSNSDYARTIGIAPSIAREDVKGVVLFSAPLRVSGEGWRFNAMLKAYLNTSDLTNSAPARQVDIVQHLTPAYPATYLTDGNQPDTFPDHAKAMAARLQVLGVDHVFNYYPASMAKLDHGYTGRLNTTYGRQNLSRAIDFMRGRSRPIPSPRGGPR